jgi:hypothetical protein
MARSRCCARLEYPWAGFDCGFALNSDSKVAQMGSAIVFGPRATLHGDGSLQHDRIEQGSLTQQQNRRHVGRW